MELKAENLFRMFWVIAIVQGKIGGLLIDPAYLWNCNFSSKSCAENNSSFTNHSSHRAVFGHKEIECNSILARHAGVNNMLRLGFLPVLNFWNEWNNFKQIFHEQVKYCCLRAQQMLLWEFVRNISSRQRLALGEQKMQSPCTKQQFNNPEQKQMQQPSSLFRN